MSARNPFAILGFGPSIFLGRNDSQVRDIAKATYRALMMVHHTDKGGSQALSVELNEAWEAIESIESFKYWKKMLLMTRRDRLFAAEARVSDLEGTIIALSEVAERLVGEALHPVGDGRLDLRNLRGVKMIVNDFFESHFASRCGLPWTSCDRFEVEQKDGHLTLHELQKRVLRQDETAEHTPWVYGPKEGFKGVRYCLERKPSGGGKIIGRIVGSVMPDRFGDSPNQGSSRNRLDALLPSKEFSQESLGKVREGFPWEVMKVYAPVWSFNAEHQSTLIVLDQETNLFRVLGRLWGWKMSQG